MRVFLCLFLCLWFSCSKTDSDVPVSCVPVEFDESKYNSNNNFGLNLIEYDLEGLCLKVKLGVSGCDDDHNIEMVSDGSIGASEPTIIFFDFYDNDPQMCEAYFTIEREFEITPVLEKFNEDVIVKFRKNQGSINLDK